MVNGNYVLYGDRPSSESEIVDDHVQSLTTDRKPKRKLQRCSTDNGQNILDNETDSVKYEKKIKEPMLLRYVPTTEVEEHFVNENFETYDLKPSEERPRRYAFIKKPKNPSDGSVNYAYSRSSSSSPSVNLPTISEHGEQYGTYRVRGAHHESPKMVDVQTGYESKLDKYFTKPRDLKFPPKGSHPDSLYRVPNESVTGAGKFTRLFRTLRWPVALVVICIALAVFVYFLMPDHINTDLELVNSTYWDTNSPLPAEERLQQTSDQSVSTSTSTNIVSTTKPTKKPGSKTPEIDFNDADIGKNAQLISIIETITDRKSTRKIPVVPVFPTRITPEVQYGNENADTNKLRSPKVLDKIAPAQDSTVKPHITQKPEKPLSVYFKRLSTSPSTTTTTSTSTETIRNSETTGDYSVYEKQDDVTPRYYSPQPPRLYPSEVTTPPTTDFTNTDDAPEVPDYYNSGRNNAAFNFTSGHSKFFGIGIEDAEKMKSTTQSSLYNTRVSPTLPTWRDRDDTTTKKYPINAYVDVPQCHSPRQVMCRGVLPYDLAGPAPTLDGIPIAQMLPQMQYLVATNCSTRARQFLCSLLEPECNPPPFPPKMPCFSLCKAVVDYCDGYIPRELVNAFKCKQYPNNNCISARSPCDSRELQCGDGTCVPRDWMCDGTRDCSTGDDEEPCITCEKGQYKCPTSGACVKKEWLCDGYNDCPNGEDEDSALCKNAHPKRKTPAAAPVEPEEEALAGSAPAPSVRRPNHLPQARHRSESKDDSKELLVMSDSNSGFRRNYTRRPSASRLTPYRPKQRMPPVNTNDNAESDEKAAKLNKKIPETKFDDNNAYTDDVNIEDLGIFDEFTKDNPEQRKQNREREKESQMGRAPYPSNDPEPEKKTYETERPKVPTEKYDDDVKVTKLDKSNKYERIIDGAALLRKAAEEAKKVAEVSTEPFNLTYDDFPVNPGPGGTSHSSPCPSGELRCVDGRCITLAQLCDGTIDCSDHADEDNCYT